MRPGGANLPNTTSIAAGLVLAIALLRVFPSGEGLRLVHLACWVVLLLIAARAVLARSALRPRDNAAVTAALALATFLIVRFGSSECWLLFASLCGGSPATPLWHLVFVNQDTFGYLEPYTSSSLRPPLYGWFATAANLFLVPTDELLRQTRSLIPYERDVYLHAADVSRIAAFLTGTPQPAL